MTETKRWLIEPDGPDGIVRHFYADGNEQSIEVVLATDYDDAIKLAAAAINALPARMRAVAVDAMRERVGR